MKYKIISIVTDWGRSLGSGHIQRMTNLAHFLNRKNGIKTYIINSKKGENFTFKTDDFFLSEIKPGSDLIIRDMRDSSIDEIEKLKKIGRVLTIDDNGKGRETADFSIDLIPNINISNRKKNLFIYGYNFTDSVCRLNKNYINKTIDVAFYPGHNPSEEYIDFILSLIPDRLTCALLSGEEYFIIKDGDKFPLKKSYSEIILSSKVLISHFGITIYEGHISGCRLIAINPTKYHSELAAIAKNEIDMINLGEYYKADIESSKRIISDLVNNSKKEKIKPKFVYQKIEQSLENFYQEIQRLL